MKVCFVSFEYPPEILGGAGTYAAHLVKGLEEKDIEVCTITSARTRRNKTKQMPGEDERIFRVPTTNLSLWRRFFFINPAISLLHDLNRVWKFDLVHFNEPHIIARSVNFPTISTFHSTQANHFRLVLQGTRNIRTKENIVDLFLKHPIGSLSEILAARASDRIICPSHNLVRQITSYCLFDEQRIHVVPNGIDLDTFDEIDVEAEVLNNYALEKDNFLLFMGRLESTKGIEYLLQAFKNIKKECVGLNLVIAGSGSYESYLKRLATGIEGISFIGFADSLVVKKTLYENCLTLVVPSLYEALPMVVLEAMACRKPVIASSVGDIPFLVKHGENGFLVKPKASESIERFINVLCENPKLREKMGALSRKIVEGEYSLNRMVNKTLGVYELLLSECT